MTGLERTLLLRHYYWNKYTEILNKEYSEEEIEKGYESLAEKGYIKNNKRSYKLTEKGSAWLALNK